MSVTHPSAPKVRALELRWQGQEERLRRIAKDLRAGRDWTIHLAGLPFVDEVPPLPGELMGRDLRGANLRRWLRPEIEIAVALEHEAPQVAAISLEALRTNTPLPDVSPFPVEVEGAGEVALAIRRDERFLLARCDREPVGVVRCNRHLGSYEFTGRDPYLEVSGLAVLAKWRRSGIGSRLLEAAEALAAEQHLRHVLLHTIREVGLVPWYESKGYVARHVRQLTYPEAPTYLDVLMAKPIQVEPRTRRAYRRSHPGTQGPGF